jgi:Outer membrane protein beta-barrel domain
MLIKNKISLKTLLAVLLISSLPAVAQRNKLDGDHENFFRIGAKGGVNINKISGKSYKEGFNFNFQAGVFLQFNFSNTFGLQPEVNFVQSSSEFSNDPNDVYFDLFSGGSQKKSKLNYLEVPLLLNINLGESKRVKLQLGPAYGGLLKQTVDSLKAKGDIYKNGEWAAIGGLWIQLPLVNIGARYKLGLTDLNGIDDQQKWKSQSIQVFVGVTF